MAKETLSAEKDVYDNIRTVLVTARQKVYTAINFAMVEAYWEIGRQIEQAVGDRAEYGKKLLQYISEKLSIEFGKGFTVRNLQTMRQFYQVFPIPHTLCAELSWSHYRLLIRINNAPRREFYLQESELEQALIDKLQEFLLELGKGFSFVARQKRLTIEGDHYYIDLVFYNFILKCFIVIDLKTGKLNYQDIGQIDFYVRYFDDQIKLPEDNPTLGIVLCADKNETMAKYSVLSDKDNLLASKYMLYIPSEEELELEIERERILIEKKLEENTNG